MEGVTCHQSTTNVPLVSHRLSHLQLAADVAALLLSLLPTELLPAPCATVCTWLIPPLPFPGVLYLLSRLSALPVPCPACSMGQPQASCCLSPSPPSPWPKALWARLILWGYLPAQPAWAHSSAGGSSPRGRREMFILSLFLSAPTALIPASASPEHPQDIPAGPQCPAEVPIAWQCQPPRPSGAPLGR